MVCGEDVSEDRTCGRNMGAHYPPCKNYMWMPRSLRMSSDLHLNCIAIPWAEFLRDGSIQTSQSPDSALKSQAHGTYFQLDNHVAYQASLSVAVAFFLKKNKFHDFFESIFSYQPRLPRWPLVLVWATWPRASSPKAAKKGGFSQQFFQDGQRRYLQGLHGEWSWKMFLCVFIVTF